MSGQVLFVGGLTPPNTGRNLSTEGVLHQLSGKYSVELVNTSPREIGRFNNVKFAKAFVFIANLKKIITSSDEYDAVYLTLNSEYGLFYDILFLIWLRNKAKVIICHHHVYNYIHKKDLKFSLLLKLLRSTDVLHVVACETMSLDLKNVYTFADSNSFLTMPPASVGEKGMKNMCRTRDGKFVVGMLANQTRSKGFFRFLEVAKQAQHEKRDWKFIMAGPAADGEVNACLLNDDLPSNVKYIGAVYEGEKDKFFRELDVFMFPSLAAQESWGIVLHEALAYSARVLTYDIACTKHLSGVAGVCLPMQSTPADFYYELKKMFEERVDSGSNVCASYEARRRAAELDHAYWQGLEDLSICVQKGLNFHRKA